MNERARSLLDKVRSILGQKETYSQEFNLSHLHSRIASAFSIDEEFLPIITADIEKCEDVMERSSLEEQRDLLTGNKRWKLFYNSVKQHILLWTDPSTSKNDKFSAVRQYLEIARKFFPWMAIAWQPVVMRSCDVCNTSVQEGERCSKCGELSNKPNETPVAEKRNTAGSIDNFMRCIKAIAVTKCDSLPEVVCSKLDQFAMSVGMYTSGEVRAMPSDKYGHRGPYAMADLLEMLKINGYTEYYPEKWWVAKNYWGWEPVQIPLSVEEEIKRDCSYLFSQCATGNNGKGGINRELFAVRILLNHSMKLSREICLGDFDIIKTPEILALYEDIWSKACEGKPYWKACPISGSWELDGK